MKFVIVNNELTDMSSRKILSIGGRVWREILLRVKPLGRKGKSGKHFPWHQVVIAFVNSDEMQKLNKKFRGKNYATDILSFAPTEESSLGELVFCADVLRRQATEHNLTFELEFTYMMIHGLLHLLGYDHEASEAQSKKMFTVQDAIFAKFLNKKPSKKK